MARRDPQLSRGWRAKVEIHTGSAVTVARLDPSQTLQALSRGSRGDPPWIWVLRARDAQWMGMGEDH